MALALTIKESHRSYNELELEPEGRFRNTVRELCGLFVTIIDSKIYLLHQTAREFLVRKTPLHPENPPDYNNCHPQWKFSLWLGDSNRILAEICIWHLMFTDFETSLSTNRGGDKYINDNIFLDYSAKNWAVHFRKVDVRVVASDSTRAISDKSSLKQAAEEHFDWGCRQPSCFLSVFSYEQHARKWAKQRERI